MLIRTSDSFFFYSYFGSFITEKCILQRLTTVESCAEIHQQPIQAALLVGKRVGREGNGREGNGRGGNGTERNGRGQLLYDLPRTNGRK